MKKAYYHEAEDLFGRVNDWQLDTIDYVAMVMSVATVICVFAYIVTLL